MTAGALKQRKPDKSLPVADGGFTWPQVRAAAECYWRGIGGPVVDYMIEMNSSHFESLVPPAPVVLSRMGSANGQWFVTLATDADQRRGFEQQLLMGSITAGHNLPKRLDRVRRADVLRHLMMGYLSAKGLERGPGRGPWCELVMRLHFSLTGQRVWCAPRIESVQMIEDPKAERSLQIRTVVHEQAPDPRTGAPSLTHEQIRNWPMSVVDLGEITREAGR